ncbi:ATP-binding protein [Streptomyces tsukubensis]|uniref:ATP-binding protein n=1 Tax=Streptomyces tsukubensis TaxID=83656 RepID=UPI00344F63BB
MTASLRRAARPGRRGKPAVAPPVRDAAWWRGRLQTGYRSAALAGACGPGTALAVQAAGMPWTWTVAAGAAAGAAALVFQRTRANGDSARLAAEQARRETDITRLLQDLQTTRQWINHWAGVLHDGEQALAAARPASAVRGPQAAAWAGGAPLPALHKAFGRALAEALDRAVRAVRSAQESAAQREAEVVARLGPRLHGMISRLLDGLQSLQDRIEDPELLRATFATELHAMLARRDALSLMALGRKGIGGTASHEPVLVATALQTAAAATEYYRRARASWPLEELWLVGYASPAVVHLLTLLIDNALRYSPGEVRIEALRSGQDLVVEIEDCGLTMTGERLAAANALLAGPMDEVVYGRLRESQIGLPVVAVLAQQYNIGVELRTNPEAGVTARVVLPPSLVIPPEQVPPALRTLLPGSKEVPAALPRPGSRRERRPAPAPAPAPVPGPAVTEPGPGAGEPPTRRPCAGTAPGAPAAEPAGGAAADAGAGVPPLPRRARRDPAPAPGPPPADHAEDTGIDPGLAGAFLSRRSPPRGPAAS